MEFAGPKKFVPELPLCKAVWFFMSDVRNDEGFPKSNPVNML
jgi:hypothetical protein